MPHVVFDGEISGENKQVPDGSLQNSAWDFLFTILSLQL